MKGLQMQMGHSSAIESFSLAQVFRLMLSELGRNSPALVHQSWTVGAPSHFASLWHQTAVATGARKQTSAGQAKLLV